MKNGVSACLCVLCEASERSENGHKYESSIMIYERSVTGAAIEICNRRCYRLLRSINS